MTDHNHEPSRAHKQSKLNTLILSGLTGALSLNLVLVGYFGKTVVEDTKANTIAMTKVAQKQDDMAEKQDDMYKRMGKMEDQIKDMVTRAEFDALKKELESLRRRSAAPRSSTP